MAAAAHNPQFAKKVGVPQTVAKEFNKADTGGKMLSAPRGSKTDAMHAHSDVSSPGHDPMVHGYGKLK